MNENVSISVVMPTYNNQTDIARGISSVLHQIHQDFELVIVNDGSTDGTEKIVRSFSDPRIRFFSKSNGGVSSARNYGVRLARHELVSFLDADDEWRPDYLETILNLYRKFPECGVFATLYKYHNKDGTVIFPILKGLPATKWHGVIDQYFYVAAHSDPPLWTSAVTVKKSALDSIGGFPEWSGVGEDLLTWARLAVRTSIAYSTKHCVTFWLRGPLVGMPTRVPESPDRIGEALDQLRGSVPANQQRHFRRYRALWHRMRASMYVHLGYNRLALTEVIKMAKYEYLSRYVLVYTILSLVPAFLKTWVLSVFNRLREKRRAI
jgi:glycosyltransferase involved in cell wall biosynthesis